MIITFASSFAKWTYGSYPASWCQVFVCTNGLTDNLHKWWIINQNYTFTADKLLMLNVPKIIWVPDIHRIFINWYLYHKLTLNLLQLFNNNLDCGIASVKEQKQYFMPWSKSDHKRGKYLSTHRIYRSPNYNYLTTEMYAW